MDRTWTTTGSTLEGHTLRYPYLFFCIRSSFVEHIYDSQYIILCLIWLSFMKDTLHLNSSLLSHSLGNTPPHISLRGEPLYIAVCGAFTCSFVQQSVSSTFSSFYLQLCATNREARRHLFYIVKGIHNFMV